MWNHFFKDMINDLPEHKLFNAKTWQIFKNYSQDFKIDNKEKVTERSSSSSTCFSINLDISGISMLSVALAAKKKWFNFIQNKIYAEELNFVVHLFLMKKGFLCFHILTCLHFGSSLASCKACTIFYFIDDDSSTVRILGIFCEWKKIHFIYL